ncbi:MAG: hypothetical protein F6K48_35320 [Okeania sp. SIO3H1]|nr:hypothetical protein [Okeania sp. SIO3H1]
MNTQELIAHFEAGTLPKVAWTHEAHLQVALWYIVHEPDMWSAACRIKAGIVMRNFNVGTPNTGAKGYHETITMFFVEELYEFYQQNQQLDFETLEKRMLSEPKFCDKAYITQFYADGVLKTPKARATYIRPTR